MVHFRQSAFLLNDKVRKVHFYKTTKCAKCIQKIMWGINLQGFSCRIKKKGPFQAKCISNKRQSAQSAFLQNDKLRKVHTKNHVGYQFTGFFVAEFKNMVHFRQSAFLINDKVRKVRKVHNKKTCGVSIHRVFCR